VTLALTPTAAWLRRDPHHRHCHEPSGVRRSIPRRPLTAPGLPRARYSNQPKVHYLRGWPGSGWSRIVGPGILAASRAFRPFMDGSTRHEVDLGEGGPVIALLVRHRAGTFLENRRLDRDCSSITCSRPRILSDRIRGQHAPARTLGWRRPPAECPSGSIGRVVVKSANRYGGTWGFHARNTGHGGVTAVTSDLPPTTTGRNEHPRRPLWRGSRNHHLDSHDFDRRPPRAPPGRRATRKTSPARLTIWHALITRPQTSKGGCRIPASAA
jgi:hypothetical protein